MQIGRTPLIKLERMAPANGVDIWVKWEGANPTGSMKDRMALSMILGAEQRGQLPPGGRVVDYTGGSTRQLAGHGLRGSRLPGALRVVGCLFRGEAPDHARVRRAARGGAERQRQGDAGADPHLPRPRARVIG